jgi:hypothetical protein
VAQEVEASLELVEHVLIASRIAADEAAAIVYSARESLSTGRSVG